MIAPGILFALATALEVSLHVSRGRLRAALAWAAGLFVGLFGVSLLLWRFDVFSVLIALLCLYRLCNFARIVWARMGEEHLRRATRTTSLTLFGLQLVVVATWAAWIAWGSTGHAVWAIVATLQACVAAGLYASTARSIRRTRWPARVGHYSDEELPTVSIAIPARNETQDLHELLVSVLASDYPKLEVLVYDDCSQTKRTPEIIRSFAHQGVRFLQGTEPPKQWLPKNYAYNTLSLAASGEYVVFCGVDVRFESGTLRRLINMMLDRKKFMLSIVPTQGDMLQSNRPHILQAMRYWWELAPPRRLFVRPPVLSTCWIVRRKLLTAAGGFAAVSRAITPEAHFARQAIAQHDGYSFLRASARLGLHSVKTFAQQRATALRVRYPQLHRRPEQVALQSFLEGSLLLLPYVLTVVGFVVSIGTVAHTLAAFACVLITLSYRNIMRATDAYTPWLGLLLPPVMVLVDVGMVHYSMWKYEFSEVVWKGRNVCLPVMQSIPKLPKV